MTRFALLALLFTAAAITPLSAETGSEAASFLDVPVGAGPAALGSAYTARATDAYAPIWNPAGLGRLQGPGLSAMHLNYLVDSRYEFASFVFPFDQNSQGLGVAAQMFGSGDIPGRDEFGNLAPSYKVSYGAYTFAYGYQQNEENSLGTSLKIVQGKISDVSATAYAADIAFHRLESEALEWSAVLNNIGTEMKFVDKSAPLASAIRAGALYKITPDHRASLDALVRRNKQWDINAGYEFLYEDLAAWRVGFTTTRMRSQPIWTAFSTGLACFFWGQEFSYAWVPYGDLGPTHYLSVVLHWGAREARQSPRVRASRHDEDDEDFRVLRPKQTSKQTSPKARRKDTDSSSADYDAIYELLNSREQESIEGDKK